VLHAYVLYFPVTCNPSRAVTLPHWQHIPRSGLGGDRGGAEREFCIDNLLVRIHFIIVMVRWAGLAPWEFEFPGRRILFPPSAETPRTPHRARQEFED